MLPLPVVTSPGCPPAKTIACLPAVTMPLPGGENLRPHADATHQDTPQVASKKPTMNIKVSSSIDNKKSLDEQRRQKPYPKESKPFPKVSHPAAPKSHKLQKHLSLCTKAASSRKPATKTVPGPRAQFKMPLLSSPAAKPHHQKKRL